MYLLESANIMYLSFIRYELLSFEHGNHISDKMYNIILLLFVRIQSSFFQPEVLHFLPIYFPHIVSISGKPYLFSWEILDSKKFNLCMYILRTEKKDGSKLMFMPFEIVSICIALFEKHVILQLIHFYINSTC